MKAPKWMRDWRDELIANAPKIEINLEPFKAGYAAPRRVKDASRFRTRSTLTLSWEPNKGARVPMGRHASSARVASP